MEAFKRQPKARTGAENAEAYRSQRKRQLSSWLTDAQLYRSSVFSVPLCLCGYWSVPSTWRLPVATGSPYSPRKNPSPSPPKNVIPLKTVNSGCDA